MFKSTLAWLNLRWFWQFLAPSFSQEPWQQRIFPQHRWLLKTIKTLKPHSILEPGCGFGRNLNYLIRQGIKPSILTGADFALKPPDSIKFVQADVLNLPFSPASFDLVFTHGLLMHLPPHKLLPAFKELLRVAKKNLILIEEIRPRSRRLNFFTWAHDYLALTRQLNLKVIQSHQDQKLSLIWLLIQK